MWAKNSKIYSDVVNMIDFTVKDPFTNITVVRQMLEYVKPKVVFDMVHNSSGFAKEQDFKYAIPTVNETKPVKVQDILFFDEKFMSFDFSTQTIIFQ